jgi:hypothetical protein
MVAAAGDCPHLQPLSRAQGEGSISGIAGGLLLSHGREKEWGVRVGLPGLRSV